MTDPYKLLENCLFGLMARVYAKNPDDVSKRVSMIKMMIERALAIEFLGVPPMFSRIDLLVPTDERYSYDCGETAPALRKMIEENQWGDRVVVTEIDHGDQFCGVLNQGMAQQLKSGMKYSMVISPEASSYMNTETMVAMLEQLANGALVVGLAINELTGSIKDGEITNTFAIYHLDSLLSLGGFDPAAAEVLPDEKGYMYTNPATGESIEYRGGVEELPFLCRLVNEHGKRLAVVDPRGDDVQLYELPPPGELLDRHNKKMATKSIRKDALLHRLNLDRSVLKGGLMAA